MPSTFLAHALDADGDGRIDLWESLPDAMHSAARYLQRAGWRSQEPVAQVRDLLELDLSACKMTVEVLNNYSYSK